VNNSCRGCSPRIVLSELGAKETIPMALERRHDKIKRFISGKMIILGIME
jgi:hypothetical protein